MPKMTEWTKDRVLDLDGKDALAAKRDEFVLPEGIIYLDGNSLGALPKAAQAAVEKTVSEEWGQDLITSWTKNDWISLSSRIGAKLAPLIGAKADEVIATESTSISLFKMVHAALQVAGERKIILTEQNNFPTDLYVLDSIARHSGGDIELKRVPRGKVMGALTKDVSVLVLTHVNFKTSEKHDMAALCKAAQAVGAKTVWDLSHSVAAMPVELNGTGADFALGCGYKFLNAGPGSPGFVFVAGRHQNKIDPVLAGWMGHAHPFDFSPDFEPADGIMRQLTGTPAVLGMVAMDAALDVFNDVKIEDLYAKAGALGDMFLELIAQECAGFGLTIACPEKALMRGSQVTLTHDSGFAIIQALMERGVIGDFRKPNIMRFGFAPLYLRYIDVYAAVMTLKGVLEAGAWHEPGETSQKQAM